MVFKRRDVPNIAIAGIGYVGLANAVLLAQHNSVTAVDVVQGKIDMINARKSPLADKDIEEYLTNRALDLTATTDGDAAYRYADYVIIATPTNYDPVENFFDTSSVEAVIQQVISVNPNAIIILKSTVPVGFTAATLAPLDIIRLADVDLETSAPYEKAMSEFEKTLKELEELI